MIKIDSKQTGAEIQIAVAPFKDAMNLKNAIFKELAKTGLNLDKVDVKNIEKTNLDDVLKPLLQIDSSKEFQDAFFACAVRCLYNGSKITIDMFEDETAREDYYTIMLEVLKANLAPFFKGLVSGFTQMMVSNKSTNTQKLKS